MLPARREAAGALSVRGFAVREVLPRALRTMWTSAILSASVGVIVLLGTLFGGDAFDSRIITGLVFMVLVIGIYIFIGNSGVVSFGHVSFMAIGGYAYALMTVPPIRKSFLLSSLPGWIKDLNVNFILATIIAGALAAVFALIIGWPLMRLSGIPASIALFAVLLVVNVFVSQAYDVTRGEQTMVGIPSTLTSSAGKTFPWVVVAIFAAGLFQSTRFGLRLRCSREDEFGAKSVGISIPRERMIALVVSAFFVGMGGAMYGALLGSLTPQAFYIETTFTTIVMLVVGGMRSLTGAVVGTVAVFTVEEILRRLEDGFPFTTSQTRWEALLVWIVAAVVALVLLRIRSVRGAPARPAGGRPPLPVAYVSAAVVGLFLWILYVATGAGALKWIAVAVLGAAAALGATLARAWLRERRRGEAEQRDEAPLPTWALVLHGVLAALTVTFVAFTAAGIRENVASRPGLELLGVSVLALLILLFRPSGLSGGREIGIPSVAGLRAVAAFARGGGAPAAPAPPASAAASDD